MRQATDLATRLGTFGRRAIVRSLAAAVTHDVSQPLTASRTNAEAALRMIDAGRFDVAEIREILRDIVAGNARAAEVLRRLSPLAEPSALNYSEFDLNSAIREVVPLAEAHAATRGMVVDLELGADIPAIFADRLALQHVVLSLLTRAFDAIAGVANARVSLMSAWEDPLVLIAVRDLGPGLSAQDLPRIFNPLETTLSRMSPELAVSRDLMRAHGGDLSVECHADSGTTFRARVPALPAVDPNPM